MQLDIGSAEGVSLRHRHADDTSFLFQVYASTRLAELANVGWDVEQITAFLNQQFSAQDAHYTQHYPTCAFYVIERQGTACGRLYLDAWPSEVRIVDIALLPSARGQGIGTRLLEAIITTATARGLPVSIHVERENPALRLYERLGFERIEERGVYFLMRRTPVP